jgi:chromosome segregation ATPase
MQANDAARIKELEEQVLAAQQEVKTLTDTHLQAMEDNEQDHAMRFEVAKEEHEALLSSAMSEIPDEASQALKDSQERWQQLQQELKDATATAEEQQHSDHARIAALEEELAAAKKATEEKEAAHATAMAEKVEEFNQMALVVKNSQEQVDTLQHDLDALRTTSEEALARIHALEEELAAAKKATEEKEAELLAQAKAMAEKVEEFNQMLVVVKNSQEQVDTLQHDLDALRTTSDTDQARIHALEEELSTATKPLASWKAASKEQEEGHATALQEMQEGHATALQEQEEGHATALQEQEEGHATALQEQEEGHATALQEQEEGHATALQEQEEGHATALQEKDQALEELRARVQVSSTPERQVLNRIIYSYNSTFLCSLPSSGLGGRIDRLRTTARHTDRPHSRTGRTTGQCQQ